MSVWKPENARNESSRKMEEKLHNFQTLSPNKQIFFVWWIWNKSQQQSEKCSKNNEQNSLRKISRKLFGFSDANFQSDSQLGDWILNFKFFDCFVEFFGWTFWIVFLTVKSKELEFCLEVGSNPPKFFVFFEWLDLKFLIFEYWHHWVLLNLKILQNFFFLNF